MPRPPCHVFLAAALCACLLCAAPPALRAADLPDLTLPTPDTNGTVHALAVGGSYLYIGGQFSEIGGVPCSNLAAINVFSGVVHDVWKPVIDGPVRALYFQPGGVLYVGGQFASVDGKPHLGAAALHAAELGADWLIDEWNPSFVGGSVDAIEYLPPRVYVGGSFIQCNGVTRNSIAAVFPTGSGPASGTLDTFWNPDVREVSGLARVNAIITNGTKLFIAGRFDTVSTATARNNIAAFNLAGFAEAEVFRDWDAGLNPAAEVFALAMDNSFLYVGGAFNQFKGLPAAKNIAAIPLGSTTGEANASWNPNVNGNLIQSIAAYGGAIYLGGQYTAINNVVPRTNLSACAPAGNGRTGEVEILFDQPATGTGVRALAVGRGRIYLGGAFGSVGGVPKLNLAGFASPLLIDHAAATSWHLYN